MKRAAREDAWRRVGAGWGDKPTVRWIDPADIDGFAGEQVEVYGGLTVICGVNASGKTRLLTAIARVAEGSPAEGSCVDVGGLQGGNVAFVDTFWMLQKQRVSISTDAALIDRVQQAGLSPLRPADLRLASYLLGHEYSSIEVAELEATDDRSVLEDLSADAGSMELALKFRPEVIPYFEVARENQRRSSATLSQGELAGLTLIWALSQLSSPLLVLIDEPETFLSPVSAQRALDIVAHYTGKNGTPCVMSSHSYLGLAARPQKHIMLLRPRQDGQTELVRSSPVALWGALRLAAPRAIIFVVEDTAAFEWLSLLLRDIDFEFLDLTDIWIGGDASNVRAAAEFPDCRNATLAIWGVLDGDERAGKSKGNLLFLPGILSPEVLVLETLRICNPALLAVPPDRLANSLVRTSGMDPHEQVEEIASDLGFGVSAFRSMTLRIWGSSTAQGQSATRSFAQSLAVVRPPDTGTPVTGNRQQ